MSRYAIINGSIVENVIEATRKPAIADRIIIQSAVAGPGDSYDGTTFTRRVPSAAEVEQADATPRMLQALPLLRAWANDAQDAAALTAMTAAQRLARQAVIEARVAALARLCVALIRERGVVD